MLVFFGGGAFSCGCGVVCGHWVLLVCVMGGAPAPPEPHRVIVQNGLSSVCCGAKGSLKASVHIIVYVDVRHCMKVCV